MITKCAWCEKTIWNRRKAIVLSANEEVEYFCSKRCMRNAQKLERYVKKVRKELGEGWEEVYAILFGIHLQGERKIKCENCLDYIEGVCKGGEGIDPFHCFFKKVKEAKEAGLKPDDIISFGTI